MQSTTTTGAFQYDDNGNLSSGGGRTSTWTSFDMPATIKGQGASASFVYGPEHQRTRQNRGDGSVVVYAGAQEVESKGGLVTVKTYWPNGLGVEIDRPNVAATELNWTHLDRLGSPVALTGQNGVIREKLAYDAWGKRRTLDGSATPNNLDGQVDNRGFTGHEMLDQLDLVHMNGRVYDPLLGRFISGDPLVSDPVNGQSYNRYSYVLNNPTNLTDPTGFSDIDPNEKRTGSHIPGAPTSAKCMGECSIKETPAKDKAETTRPNGKVNSTIKGSANTNTSDAGGDKKPKEGDHDYAVWTKLKEKCDGDCVKDWQNGSKLFSYPSENLKPSPADLSGRPQVVYGTLPFFDANDPSNYTTPGGRVVQSQGANGTITNTTLQDHVFCCGTISRTLMITKDDTLYMYTHGVGYNVYMGTDIRSNALSNFNSSAGQKIFRALDQQLIKYMNEEKK